MITSSSEESSKLESNSDEQEILNFINNIPKINIGQDLSIYLDQKKTAFSLSPIFPVNKIDFLFKLYNLNINKEELSKKIKQLLNKKNSNKSQIYIQNRIKIQNANDQLKIIDELFIKDCLTLSKANQEGSYIIVDRISNAIFGESVNYKYQTNEENKKRYVIASLNFKDNIFIQSDYLDTDAEAKLNVNKKIINKYLPKKNSREIINNIDECIKNDEEMKKTRKAKYEKFLEEVGGDRKLLHNKRKLTLEEFSRRLPNFHMLDKEKHKKNNLLEEDEEIYFINTKNCPIDKILLGDLGIVDNHLKDFKYTPLKLFQMIRDSEKKRGVDLKMDYTQVNDKKNYSHNSEATIFSQKLGLKVEGYGNSKEEAENKCALNMLAIIFKDKFKTFLELHEYFRHKNGKYLDIILKDEKNEIDETKPDTNNNEKPSEAVKNSSNNKMKKNEENIVNSSTPILKENNNIETYESKPIYFNTDNFTFESMNDYEENNNTNVDINDNLENFNSDISSNISSVSTSNFHSITPDFGNLFNCNSYNNDNMANKKNNNNSKNNLSNEKTDNNLQSTSNKLNKKVEKEKK